jgi:hypothetical protein
VVPVTAHAETLAGKYIESGVAVEMFCADALHVAIASTHGMEYLVSWNFRHIVNVRTGRLVDSVNVWLGKQVFRAGSCSGLNAMLV